MSSKNDNTLSLPEMSQELSFDITADEDFIPPSQPQSTDSSKISKNSDPSFGKSIKNVKCSDAISDSNIIDTPPFKAVIDQSTIDWDESADFIPETETKKTKGSYAAEDFSCKKKLSVFSPDDIFKVQSSPTVNSDDTRIIESPALETLNFSILNDSHAKTTSDQERVKKVEESVSEIIVNDSAETVDLETASVRTEKLESGRSEEKLEISCSLTSDAERCEETQVFDNSSVLLLGQSAETLSSDLEKSEISKVTPEKLYLQQTIDDDVTDSQKEANHRDLKFDVPPVVAAMLTEKPDVDVLRPNENSVSEKEVQANSIHAEPNATVVTRKIDFRLTVSCLVTVNAKTNKVLRKIISNVNEIPNSKPKPAYVENASDNTSDKSKRYSTSSSGSVYSDKMGLPFALTKRVSARSDLTDSSEDEFGLFIKERKAIGRIPWTNEYLLPLKMDDIMQIAIEKEELLKRPMMSSPRKPESRHCDVVKPLREILESSSSEQTSLCNLDTREPIKMSKSGEVSEKGTPENSETLLTENIKRPGDSLEKIRQEETVTNNLVSGSGHGRDRKEEETSSQPKVKRVDSAQKSHHLIERVEGQTSLEEESTSIRFCDGLAVFARWTDKLYYSGVIHGNVKNDRWDVKFDDGTWKAVREDFIMPAEWLKSGALVFVLVDDKYESGQIVNVKQGEEVNYTVELDITKKEVSVKISDLCLTDVMAGIVREKYKPLVGTPRGKTEIDFDNVLTGKRLREQRTPLKPLTVQIGNSGICTGTWNFDNLKVCYFLTELQKSYENATSPKRKKKTSSKRKRADEVVLESSNTDTGLMGGLKSENGHLLEDKVVSADSPSGNETVETPLRGKPKEPRRKAKPRSLSYTFEETRIKKNWLAPDGTPIPGPSGIKVNKHKLNAKKTGPEVPTIKNPKSPTMVTRSSKKCPTRSKALQLAEKSVRKRKLEEFVDDNIQEKSLKEGSKVKRRAKKG